MPVTATFLIIPATEGSAAWVSRQALETEAWTRTSSALLEHPAVQTALAAYLVDELCAYVDVAGELRRALPDRADRWPRSPAEDVARRALARPRVHAAGE